MQKIFSTQLTGIFNNINKDDIMIMGPYDINSHITEYGFTSGNKQIYIFCVLYHTLA